MAHGANRRRIRVPQGPGRESPREMEGMSDAELAAATHKVAAQGKARA